jgi:DNA-binding NtrC family response regulator
MKYKKKKRIYGKNKNYSVIQKLLTEEKISEKFLLDLNELSLEEIIALKLEVSAKSSGGTIFGVPIWNSLRDICRDATLKFAVSAARTKAEAATFLGISIHTLKDYLKKYEIEEYFEEKNEKII